MAGFVYFISGDRRPVDQQRVADLGFGYVLDGDGAVSSREVNANSPSGVAGRVFGVESRLDQKSLGVYPEQIWRRAAKSDVWVGYWKDATPTPEQLLRTKTLPGPTLELSDGNRWQVPLVLSLDLEASRYEPNLPATWDFDEDGNWVRGDIVEEYRLLWDVAVPFADDQFDVRGAKAKVQPMDLQKLLHAVVTLLQANYVVGQTELVMLKALADDQATGLVPLLACDFFTLASWAESQKKSESQKANAGGGTSDGAMD